MPRPPLAPPPLAARLVALVALVAVSACDGGGPEASGLTGTWTGVVYDAETPNATRYPIELRLRDTGARITGSGFVDELPEGRFEFAVTNGAFLEDLTVTLELQFQQPPFIGGLSGRLTNRDPGRVEGTFSGRGTVGNSRVRIEITSRS